MLSHVEVSNFQSLRKVRIRLGRLTVITGPTGAGKSALIRALLLLARNAIGTSYVTAAEKSCSVAAGNGDWAARITRSNSPRGRNEYVTVRRGGKPVKYTKLDKKVPAQVSELLGLSELNFARQHDPPYLLSEPGTAIARKLGELTNVSLVFGAAADANRARKQLSRDLEAARARRDALKAEAREFATLGASRRALTAAGEALGRVQGLAASAERLEALAGRLELLELRLAGAQEEAARQAPPSLEKLDALAARAARLRELAGALRSAEREAAGHAGEADAAREAEAVAHEAIHDALAAAGQCPTCLQAVA